MQVKQMGAWGTGLYQNDLSADVKDDYISKLKGGKTDEEALQEIMEEYREEMEDVDCKYDFFLGLADTLWKKGRLTEELKTKALEMLEEEITSDRWESEKLRKERNRVLDRLKEELNSPMPERKKVSVHKPYKTGWKEGEVYAFQIKELVEGYEEYNGWYALFYINRIYLEDWNVHGVEDEVVEAYFFLRKEKPESVIDLKTSTNVCFLKTQNGNRYCVEILEKSKSGRPKDLQFLGKCEDFVFPLNNTVHSSVFTWGSMYTWEILAGYVQQLAYEKGL